MTRVNFTLTDWDKDMLAELSARYGVSNSDMIRRLIMLAHARMEMEAEAKDKEQAAGRGGDTSD